MMVGSLRNSRPGWMLFRRIASLQFPGNGGELCLIAIQDESKRLSIFLSGPGTFIPGRDSQRTNDQKDQEPWQLSLATAGSGVYLTCE